MVIMDNLKYDLLRFMMNITINSAESVKKQFLPPRKVYVAYAGVGERIDKFKAEFKTQVVNPRSLARIRPIGLIGERATVAIDK
jgi:hypothetical protein